MGLTDSCSWQTPVWITSNIQETHRLLQLGSGKGNVKITHSTHLGSYWDIPLSSVKKEKKIMHLKHTTYELFWIVMALLRPHRRTALIAAELNHWLCYSQWNQITNDGSLKEERQGYTFFWKNKRTVSAWCGTDSKNTLLPKILNTYWNQ